ncbi:hypothetical protein [Streptomyces sp. HNM0574]|uniref:hypothetical protein n=1 Tax=Streptomyces sp. HNM0574 TaxID=2714954 RepID=UPI001469C1AB|nr:hypothetical protein [Streptomyces sp. HNM0574]NLU67763.1 hypothetical protein [Streptomyces sp. HNM0574]
MFRSGRDNVSSVAMLHSSILDKLQGLTSSFHENLQELRQSSETAQRQTREETKSELAKLRKDFTQTHNRVTTVETRTADTVDNLLRLHRKVDALSAALSSAASDLSRLRHEAQAPSEAPVPAPTGSGGAVGGRTAAEHATAPAGTPTETGPVTDKPFVPSPRTTPEQSPAEQRPDTTGSTVKDPAVHTPQEPAEPSREGQENHVPSGEEVEYRALLLRAAGISSGAVICHRDTWDFLVARASGHAHFRPPREVTDHGQGRVRAVLSGRSLIAALSTLRETRLAHGRELPAVDGADADWALAETLYRRLRDGIHGAGTSGPRPLTITFDDGVPEEGADDGTPGHGEEYRAGGGHEDGMESRGDGESGEPGTAGSGS